MNRLSLVVAVSISLLVSVASAADLSDGKSGVLLITFDDRNFAGWESSAALFAKYDAHATFFISGAIDERAVKAASFLAGKGHSVGLHGLAHRDADKACKAMGNESYYAVEMKPQLDACKAAGIKVRNYAYPNCCRDDNTDALFRSNGWQRVRGGVKGGIVYDPKGVRRAEVKPVATNDKVFFPAAELPSRFRLDTIIMGEAYHTDIDDILAAIRRAAERKEVLVITSHNIGPNAKGINMKSEWLERMLALASELKLPTVGFDELPPVK